jgi:hypothetical protein
MCMILIVDMQLLQNIMKANEVQFPEPLMAELHPDCIDMCRKLLRPNPESSVARRVEMIGDIAWMLDSRTLIF